MEKKYQVFVSSTYEDLRVERQEVIHALLELDCIPSGMELFPAADEDQWSLIKGVIDECDYYLLILGGRYGSCGDDGIGYTEKEYRYALEQGKPIISFLHKEPEALPKKHTEQSEAGQKKFLAFRNLVQNKMCKFWESPQELGSVASRSLINLQKKHPGTGWVKGDLIPSQEASIEILELKKEIESLEKKLETARTQAPPGTETLAQGSDVFPIDFSYECKKRGDKYTTYTGREVVELSWDRIFYQISPLMINEATDSQLASSINSLIKTFGHKNVLKQKDAKDYHAYSGYRISEDDFHTIKVQLRALGLITKSERSRSIKDRMTYWTLTPYGDGVMNRLRAIKKEDSEETGEDDEL